MASGRQRALQEPAVADLTVNELLARYWCFAKSYYRKDGRSTDELENIRHAARPVKNFYGGSLVKEFGPLSLKTLQLQVIGANLCRKVINSREPAPSQRRKEHQEQSRRTAASLPTLLQFTTHSVFELRLQRLFREH